MLRIAGWPSSITWDQFREVANRPAGVNENALINPITSNSGLQTDETDGMHFVSNLTYTILVNSDVSWVVAGHKTDELLVHEQVHFDILGLKMRGMMQQIEELRKPSLTELGQALNELLQQTQTDASEMNETYDTETNHGINREAQARWEQRIREAIRAGGGI
jgi:hypothetical protein